jgi:TRAP transporter TAXI family solute receptor
VPSGDLLAVLQQRYGADQYPPAVIPAGSYRGQAEDVPTVGSATVLVVDPRLDEGLAYEITRAIFDHAFELAAIHPVARSFSPARAASGSPVPYHPGAIRFYRERGAWGE